MEIFNIGHKMVSMSGFSSPVLASALAATVSFSFLGYLLLWLVIVSHVGRLFQLTPVPSAISLAMPFVLAGAALFAWFRLQSLPPSSPMASVLLGIGYLLLAPETLSIRNSFPDEIRQTRDIWEEHMQLDKKMMRTLRSLGNIN